MRSMGQKRQPEIGCPVNSISSLQQLLFLTVLSISGCSLLYFGNAVAQSKQQDNTQKAAQDTAPATDGLWVVEFNAKESAQKVSDVEQKDEVAADATKTLEEPKTLVSESLAESEEFLAEEEPSAEEKPLADEKSLINEETPSEIEQESIADESNDTLDTLTDEPVTESRLKISAQQRADLEQQFERVRSRLETEDAFSEVLGEEYLSYGLLLKDAGRLDEAREMVVDALHIAKINNGIYSAEQLPVLYALFDVHVAMNDVQRVEESISRIIWLENYISAPPNPGTFDRLVRAGNYFLDEFFFRPVVSEQTFLYLDSADKYLSAAVNFFGRRPMTEMLMPYGELALVNFHKSAITLQLGSTLSASSFNERSRPPAFGDSRIPPGGFNSDSLDKIVKAPGRALSRGEFFLRQYLRKATAESNQEQIINALTGLGDVNLLSNREVTAAGYYRAAWEKSQTLPEDHPQRIGFQSPVKLPAFNYAQPRKLVKLSRKSIFVPLTLDVDNNGKVENIAQVDAAADVPYFSRARRAARRLVFRPVIENGSMTGVENYVHDVRVLVRRKKS